eukprot:CAMPEP_0119563768 /NCGR_PEP_ID=MMETSP1352-20130426/24677_1 /TAXON_ID=265584 /ORGANISM="Stauroneis constricta, Strain CCMP1120" /LENGTH=458 /DNA_ID=CAMNT_0007612435 /DNA_START=94 /DNA_END=1470 /DNA_ORIENTATION=-
MTIAMLTANIQPNGGFVAHAAAAATDMQQSASVINDGDETMELSERTHVTNESNATHEHNDGGDASGANNATESSGNETTPSTPQWLLEWREWYADWQERPICIEEGCHSDECWVHPSCMELCKTEEGEDDDDEDDVEGDDDEDDDGACYEHLGKECSVCTDNICDAYYCITNGCCDARDDRRDAECWEIDDMFCNDTSHTDPKCWGPLPMVCMRCHEMECDMEIFRRYDVCQSEECCHKARLFEFFDDTDVFIPTPNDYEIATILEFLDTPNTNLSAPLLRRDNVLSKEKRDRCIRYMGASFLNIPFVTDNHAMISQLGVNATTLIDLIGKEDLAYLLDFMAEFTDAPVTSSFIQRFEHDGTIVSPYHLDGNAVSLVILLNDDYEGGEMTFLRSDGPTVVPSKAGSASIHGVGMVHGNAAVKGVKYQLSFVAHPGASADKDKFRKWVVDVGADGNDA